MTIESILCLILMLSVICCIQSIYLLKTRMKIRFIYSYIRSHGKILTEILNKIQEK